jgi:hypothetical protein
MVIGERRSQRGLEPTWPPQLKARMRKAYPAILATHDGGSRSTLRTVAITSSPASLDDLNKGL